MRITIAQLNPMVGDIEGNLTQIKQAAQQAANDQADIIVFPELFLTGYPPRDLLDRPDIIAMTENAIEDIKHWSTSIPNTGILIGYPERTKLKKGLYNAVTLIEDGKKLFTQHKSLLPYYDVFDEARYFNPAENISTFPYKGETLGILICEDAWGADAETRVRYEKDPMETLDKQGATIFIVPMASPFEMGKIDFRNQLFSTQVNRFSKPAVFVNQVGGQDEIVFDGHSCFFNAKGEIESLLPGFDPSVQTIDTNDGELNTIQRTVDKVFNLKRKRQQNVSSLQEGDDYRHKKEEDLEDVRQALVVGLRDYVHKTGFSRALIGLSGGIDSALVAVIAEEALGKDNVLGISMPSPYSSEHSQSDAQELAKNLGITFDKMPITNGFLELKSQLTLTSQGLYSHLDWANSDQLNSITEQNIQSRLRGLYLMGLSNQLGALLLSTGNKSEMAVGYCTLYGDMNGALNVLADVPKTIVYNLAEHINTQRGEVIPTSIITKAPSAELAPDQKDSDSLPAYDILDGILTAFLEEHKSVQDIIDEGFKAETVEWVVNAIHRNEYKRRQACPGIKISSKAFGMGRRIPITSKFPVKQTNSV